VKEVCNDTNHFLETLYVYFLETNHEPKLEGGRRTKKEKLVEEENEVQPSSLLLPLLCPLTSTAKPPRWCSPSEAQPPLSSLTAPPPPHYQHNPSSDGPSSSLHHQAFASWPQKLPPASGASRPPLSSSSSAAASKPVGLLPGSEHNIPSSSASLFLPLLLPKSGNEGCLLATLFLPFSMIVNSVGWWDSFAFTGPVCEAASKEWMGICQGQQEGENGRFPISNPPAFLLSHLARQRRTALALFCVSLYCDAGSQDGKKTSYASPLHSLSTEEVPDNNAPSPSSCPFPMPPLFSFSLFSNTKSGPPPSSFATPFCSGDTSGPFSPFSPAFPSSKSYSSKVSPAAKTPLPSSSPSSITTTFVNYTFPNVDLILVPKGQESNTSPPSSGNSPIRTQSRKAGGKKPKSRPKGAKTAKSKNTPVLMRLQTPPSPIRAVQTAEATSASAPFLPTEGPNGSSECGTTAINFPLVVSSTF